MKKTGKILETVIILGACIFLGYCLLSGRAVLTVKGYLVLFVMLPLGLIMMFMERRREKKQEKNAQKAGDGAQKAGDGAQKAGDGAQKSICGSIRTPMLLRWVVAFILIVFWGMVLIFSWLAYQDGAFAYDPSAITSFVTVWVILIVLTVLLIAITAMTWKEVYYDEKGFTVKSVFQKKTYTWQDVGEVKPVGAVIFFYDRMGKKLFQAGEAYGGFTEFWNFYQNR